MRDRLEALLRSQGRNADYLEVRLEETASTRIVLRGAEVEEIGETTGRGGCVRALVRGGWGFVSFNTLEGLEERADLAVRHARLVGREASCLAEVEPVVDSVPPHLVKDPRPIPLAEKKALLDEYAQTALSVPGIQTCLIAYSDAWRRVVLATSEGTYLEQERVDVSLRVSVIARRDGDVQQAGLSIGSLGDFGVVENLHGQVEDLAHKAVAMLSAPYLPGGEYTVILDPVLAGVFIHEAFGHLSEADHIYENPRLREVMTLGRRFGEPILNVVDSARVPGLRGSYRYDDEGVPAGHTYLIREGVLVGRLHSRETAGKMGERPTGNARAISHAFPPIVRMSNTYIEPGEATLEDLLEGVRDGVYCKNWYGGMTSMEQFTFSAGEAYRIRNGRVEEMVRPVQLSGNLFDTLARIDAIAGDLEMNQGGGCGKAGQSPLPVSNGSPHIRIRRCLVGGRET